MRRSVRPNPFAHPSAGWSRVIPALVAATCLFALGTPAAVAATKLLVTVADRRTGAPITSLSAGDFTFTADGRARVVEDCKYTSSTIDVVLLVDSSQMGEQMASLAPSLIGELEGKEQMSIVAYDNSAQLIQDFTSSRTILMDALGEIQFGNSPRLLDALYAVAADGFEASVFRRVILVLTTGVDGPSGVSDREVVQVCRRNGVSIYPVYGTNYGRSGLEKLARLTGGAAFDARKVTKEAENPSAQIYDAMRSHYLITLRGNLPLGDKMQVEVRGRKKKSIQVSILELN